MTEKTDRFLPIWLWIIIVLQVFLVLIFSVGTAMRPGDFIPDVTELNYVTQLYLTRNITVAFGMILALFLKSHKALLLILSVRLFTDIADVVTVYAFSADAIKSSVPLVVILLIIPAFLAVNYLWRRVK